MHQQTGFIFDMDGTLINNMAFHTLAWQRFLSNLGIDMTDAEINQHNHGTIEENIRRICGDDLSKAEVSALGDQKECLYRSLYRPHLKPIEGLTPFLQAAQRLGIPMAIGTSSGQQNITFVLDGLGIASYFTACVGGDHVSHGKPHPETFLTAAQKLGIAPEHCIVFEDTLAGIAAAQHARMKAIALTTTAPASVFENLPGIQHIIQNYSLLNPESLLL